MGTPYRFGWGAGRLQQRWCRSSRGVEDEKVKALPPSTPPAPWPFEDPHP